MADIKKYIDVEYLRSFWNHIKSIPEQVDYLLNGKEQTIQEAIDELGKDKQDKLEPGFGIEIQDDNTIDSEVEYIHQDEKWKPQTWNGYTDSFSGYEIWRDYNGVIHYDQYSDHYYLDSDNETWIKQTWSGYTQIHGSYVWTDNNGVIHYDSWQDHYYLDSDGVTWKQQTWLGYNGLMYGERFWRDYDGVIHYSDGNKQYYLDSDNIWIQEFWSGFSSITGFYIWRDNNGIIHYDNDNKHYYLDSDGVTWKQYTWSGYTSITGIWIWTDNNGIIHYDDDNKHYYLDSDGVTWKQYTWSGYTGSIIGNSIWRDYNGIFHYDESEKHYYLQEGKNGYFTNHDDELQTKLTAGKNISIKDGVISATASVELGSGHEQAAPGDHTHNEFEIMQNQITALSLGLKLTLSVSPGNGPKGEAQSYKWTAKFEGADPDSITIYDENGDVFLNQDNTVADTPLTSINKSITKTLTSKLTYTAKARYMGMTFQASAATTPYYRILYGFCTGDAHPVTKFGTVRTTAVGAKLDGTATANGQVFKIYIPEGVTPPSGFSMGGAPATYNKGTNVTVNGVVYTPYVSGATYNTGASVSIAMS